MGILGLGDDVKTDDTTNDQNQSDSKQTDKAVKEKLKAKQDAETCEFC